MVEIPPFLICLQLENNSMAKIILTWCQGNHDIPISSGGTTPSRGGTIFDGDVTVPSGGCVTKSVYFSCDWSATTSSTAITITPSSGMANVLYELVICASASGQICFHYCGIEECVDVSIVEGSETCLTQGTAYTASASAQTLTIPTTCCVQSLSTTLSSQIFTSYFTLTLPKNDSGVPKQYSVTVNFCDGRYTTIQITQSSVETRWVTVSGEYICDGYSKYAKEKKQESYDGGVTWSDVSPLVTRSGALIEANSRDCGGSGTVTTRWVETTDTYCSGTTLYIIEKEQESLDGGVTWTDTGNTRLGSSSGTCGETQYEYRWVITSDKACGSGYEQQTRWVQSATTCVGTDKYAVEVLQVSSNGTTWNNATPYSSRTTTLIESDSTDCGGSGGGGSDSGDTPSSGGTISGYENGYAYVDLGLPSGTKWAVMNIGASSMTDGGLYFQWADTVGYTADQATGSSTPHKDFYKTDYKYYSTDYSRKWTKYYKDYDTAQFDAVILELSDDAARANLGGNWKTPSKTQCDELVANTTQNLVTIDGVSGILFIGQNGNSMFSPFAGQVVKNWSDSPNTLSSYGRRFWWWVNELYQGQLGYDEDFANEFGHTTEEPFTFYSNYMCDRYAGCTVRGVIG